MNDADKVALVKKHAPVMWLHEREAFLPTDCTEAVEISDLYRKNKRVPDSQQPHDLAGLAKVSKSEECYLKIRDLDMRTFEIPPAFSKVINSMGPAAVAELARFRYGGDYMADGIPTDDINLPKYYARVSEVNLKPEPGDPFTVFHQQSDPAIFGRYTFIEYFFYFIYNDAWNQHQGDWDSMVEVYIKNDRAYMITHLHTEQWICKLPDSSVDIGSWLAGWNAPKKGETREAYVLNIHPYVFVARGAHAGYPTPGYSVHGAGLPGDDFLTNTDERQIGRLCMLPDNVSEETIRTNLRVANIEVNKLRFGKWREPELVSDQAWRGYKGKWGEDTKYRGWDGPQNPPISKRPDWRNLKRALQNVDYEGGSVLLNWHGVR